MTERDEPQQPNDAAGITRRDFINKTAVAGAGVMIVPRHVLGRGFQAPSDTVNIATVGVGGMGGSNTRRLMSQNIVAICDVDDALARCAAEAHGRTTRRRAAAPRRRPRPSRPQARASRRRRSAANETRPRIDDAAALRRFIERADAETRSDTATTARCSTSRRTSTRSSSRRRITCTPSIALAAMDLASTSTCRSRSAGRSRKRGSSRRKRRRNPKRRHADGQPGTLERRSAPRLRIHSRRARSATCVRSTCGRTDRSATGRRAIPRPGAAAGGRRRAAPRPLAWPLGRRHTADRRRAVSRGAYHALRRSRGISSSASRRPSTTTRSITRSTGADGWTGARARSATWART